MNLPPIYESFRKRGIRFVTNACTFKTNCPECKEPNTNFVELDDDGQGFRCHCVCGFSGAERLRPPWTPGGDGPAPRNDADERRGHEEAQRRAFEEARREFDPEPEPEPEQNLDEEAQGQFPDDDEPEQPQDAPEPELEPEPEPVPAPEPPQPEIITIAEATALRRELVAAGYRPIPLYGKVPPAYGKNNPHKGLAGWQNLTSVTDEMIDMWARTWPDAVNTGVLTRNVPALDLDILNEEAVRACEDLVRDRYEDAGVFLVRIGP